MGTGIQWTNETWNPVIGCSRVSEGCRNCYAERDGLRVLRQQLAKHGESAYEGIVESGPDGKGRWTRRVAFLPERLDQPIRWAKPRMVFVNSMSDLFHEDLTNEQIAAVFGVMAAAPRHTYQVLTKRPQRMLEWFQWIEDQGDESDTPNMWCAMGARLATDRAILPSDTETRWPLPNVWLGVSAEDQATYDARVPLLLRCPAAVRWISAEPLLGPIDLTTIRHGADDDLPVHGTEWGLDWVVVGGESGPDARPFDVRWAEEIVQQCVSAGTPVFVKQLGSRPFDSLRPNWTPKPRHGDAKWGEPDNWPLFRIRLRQWPFMPGGAS